MTLRNNTLIALVLTMLWPALFFAQQPTAEQTGGVYYAYPVDQSVRLPIPSGYVPFYISHYGRHGSRWLPTAQRYEWVEQQLADADRLTPLGLSVRRRVARICRNARGNAGQLTPLGARQHRQIARRMAANYPEVFSGNAVVTARSSTVPRCRASMLAALSALPCKGVTGQTEDAFMSYLNHESAELKSLSEHTRRQPAVDPTRFVASLFRHPSDVSEPLRLLSELHTLSSDMQDIPLKLSLWDIFTPEECMAVYEANNERMTIVNGDTIVNNGIAARSSIALWQNIVAEADTVIATGKHGASLRYGHDTALFRLLTLLRLQLPARGMDSILPMAANLQMVFCRNAEGHVLVAFLHNEQPRLLPIQPAEGNFYDWDSVKDYMTTRLHQLEHQRQLCSLNTMVGTAAANTLTAGLFGKGSEEHGQTLPAVLTPNGQTFFTPQTRSTERKCIAPYYYADSLFEGIRCSHWLVGGCTQDYGSFTVSTLTTRATATRFSHAGEVSHPHYYAVTLPDEQLTTELTALSHTAALRTTPAADLPVYIVIRPNSDEQLSAITIDTLRHLVLASNPVHRIYQGWGQPAGFSGHLALVYTDRLVSYEQQGDSVLTLVFQGRKGKAVELFMATSFTSQQGALYNLQAESTTFSQMMRRSTELWTERLHTIDVSDADTARVNRFYGALYRSSFLPREMSDCDGTYPRFGSADGLTANNGRKHYGDFSMWDTYRALHPLLNIIAPQEAADMMQSLTDMATEGGWLPIFPCWNSYTAAMIGDHCTSVLADAYVKGIRNFDAPRAYEAMRRNAFCLPDTYTEYADGMGRRALDSYLRLGYIPLEDSVKEAFHQGEQTSRTLEYAYDDFCVAQMARALGHDEDYHELMRRSENWRNVVNPATGWADGRHADGRWEGNTDLVNRKPYITEGATCHYTWYVPQNPEGLILLMGGSEAFTARLDSMFSEGRYWHGNEPCHQIAWLYALAGHPEKTREHVAHILLTEYNDTPGGLSGNDDAGQMSAWQVFAMMGFYPVCPATPYYVVGSPSFSSVIINAPHCPPLTIAPGPAGDSRPLLNGKALSSPCISHTDLTSGGLLLLPSQ